MLTARKTSWVVVVCSALAHVGCCVLPAVALLVSFGSNVGLFAGVSSGWEWVHQIEIPMLVIGGVFLALATFLQIIEFRKNCPTHVEGAPHCGHKASRRVFPWVLVASIVIYAVSAVDILVFHHHMV